MRLLVCGGRDYGMPAYRGVTQAAADKDRMWAALDYIHARTPITLLIHGAATGADTMAGRWAKERGVSVQEFPANWLDFRQEAGKIRNKHMLDEGKPDRVLAFPGRHGTKNMVSQATKQGVPTVRLT